MARSLISTIQLLSGIGLVLLTCQSVSAQTQPSSHELLYHWSQLVDNDTISFRAITTAPQCPQLEVDGNTLAMRATAVTLPDFPYRMCELRASAQAARVTWDQSVWPTLPAQHRDAPSIGIVGDTGCRISGRFVQPCTPDQWPWQKIADAIASSNVDLVLHLGDYHYREDCAQAECEQEPRGMNWAAWQADWFTPSQKLMASKVLVLTRGNHEDTNRAWRGWNAFLAPTLGIETPQAYTAAWTTAWGPWSALIIDNSSGTDNKASPEQVQALRDSLAHLRWTDNTWWIMHRPMWLAGSPNAEQGSVPSRDAFFPLIQGSSALIVSGHAHLGQVLVFDDQSPNQIIVGHSGTALEQGVTDLQIDSGFVAKRPIMQRTDIAGFGWLKAQYQATPVAQWQLSFIDQAGTIKRDCSYSPSRLICR